MSDACLLLVGVVVEDTLLSDPQVAQLVRQAAQAGLPLRAVSASGSPAARVDAAGLDDVIQLWSVGAAALADAIAASGHDPARTLVLASEPALVSAATAAGATTVSDATAAHQHLEQFTP
jgi:hypothetical protein